MKMRFRFAKRAPLQYLGHLDVMRYFQKAIRRADLPVRYSEGFSPHMLLSFASPLGVGKTSEGEYFDLELTEDMDPLEAVRRLQKEMIQGMEVLAAADVGEGKQSNGMRMIAAATYRIILPSSLSEEIAPRLDDFLAQTSIIVTQKSKKGTREKDIRPGIYELEMKGDSLHLFVSASSAQNIRPESVLDALASFCGTELPPTGISIIRMELFMERGNDEQHDFCSLLDAGKELHASDVAT